MFIYLFCPTDTKALRKRFSFANNTELGTYVYWNSQRTPIGPVLVNGFDIWKKQIVTCVKRVAIF